jgi:hypothetical protein
MEGLPWLREYMDPLIADGSCNGLSQRVSLEQQKGGQTAPRSIKTHANLLYSGKKVAKEENQYSQKESDDSECITGDKKIESDRDVWKA